VAGAELTVTPWMPSMGHGVFERPVVTERGGGLYSVGNIDLIMGGHWELRVQVKKDGLEDNATFDFPDVRSGEAHPMTGAPSASSLDLSATRFSAHKIFKVSFTSRLDPIVINRMHSWELKVETPQGLPVTGAARPRPSDRTRGYSGTRGREISRGRDEVQHAGVVGSEFPDKSEG
jgi:hypothetical protein